MSKQETKNKEELVNLLNSFIAECQKQKQREENQYLLDFLTKAQEKLSHNQQNSVDEARTIYQNVNTICLASHIKLTDNESKILKEINELSAGQGIWSNMNALNTVNTWPGI